MSLVTVENTADLKDFLVEISNASSRRAYLSTPLPSATLMINGTVDDVTLAAADAADIITRVQRFLLTKRQMERELIRARTDAAIIGFFLAVYVKRFGKAETKFAERHKENTRWPSQWAVEFRHSICLGKRRLESNCMG
jgi:hypothetical protein